MPSNEEVGCLLRRWREAAGWTQEQAADAAGVGVAAWGWAESGRRPLSSPHRAAYAQALGVDVLALTRDPLDVLRGRAR